MNLTATILTSGISFGLLACVGGIGWLLTVYCLWDKYDRKKDKPIHLASDIINATFAAITLVVVVNFAVNLSVKLPDIISNRVAGDIKLAVDQKAALTLADEIIRLNRDDKLNDDTLNEVIQRQFKGLRYVNSDSPLVLQVDQRRIQIERGLKGRVLP